MGCYRLGRQADEDFESIYVYGVLTFGLEQAEACTEGLERRFEQIATEPLLYPAIDHVRPGYRRTVYGSHAVYYRLHDDIVLIVRILRSQDVVIALPEKP
ncbi:type II toxin-antitoxin system RelE/ParE family toxin [Marinobacter sp.]|uniref:type II toxin-antitoxin system RelE/ParE family toxin n=1 Tax=Marinobacter sp. TaxID=50741 RepID=UPI0039AF2B6C